MNKRKWMVVSIVLMISIVFIVLLSLSLASPISKECAYFCQGNKSLMVDMGNYCIDCSKIC